MDGLLVSDAGVTVHALFAADDNIFIERNISTKLCNTKIDLEENFKPSIFLFVIMQDNARTLTSQPRSLMCYGACVMLACMQLLTWPPLSSTGRRTALFLRPDDANPRLFHSH